MKQKICRSIQIQYSHLVQYCMHLLKVTNTFGMQQISSSLDPWSNLLTQWPTNPVTYWPSVEKSNPWSNLLTQWPTDPVWKSQYEPPSLAVTVKVRSTTSSETININIVTRQSTYDSYLTIPKRFTSSYGLWRPSIHVDALATTYLGLLWPWPLTFRI